MSNQIYANFEKRIKYNVNTTHIETSPDGEFTIINNDLVLNVVENLLNEDILNIDNMGVVSKMPISALPPPTPPSINLIASNIAAPNRLVTQDSIDTLNESLAYSNFNGDLITPGDLKVSGETELGIIPGGTYPPSTIKINSTHSQLSTYSNAGDPQVNFSTKTQFGSTSGAINIGCFEDENGIMKMAPGGTSAFSVFRNLTDVWLGSSRSDPGDPGTCQFFTGINFRPTYTRFYTRCFMGDGLTISPPLPDKLCVLDGLTNEARVINRDEIFNQDLLISSSVEFIELSVGPQTVTPATDTRSQLKVSGPIGDLGPFPKNDIGGRIEIYNDGNQYPLVSLSCFRPDDCAISFGSYGSSIDPWVKSDINFFKWQKLGSELGLYCNQTLSVAGNPAFEELMVKYNNTGLNPLIEFHQPLKLFSTTSAPTNTRFLTLNSVSDEIEERILPAFGTGDVSWIGGLSVNNSVARYDSTSGLIIQGSGVIIDDSDNIICNQINTGNGLSEIFSMDQDVLSTSSVDFKNIFCDNIIQSDFILETTLNAGVKVDSWQIKTQKIKSDALVSVTNPLTIELKYFGDNESAMSLIAENHDNNGILFDMNHVDNIGTTNDYLSGSVNGNIFINKDGGDLNFLFQNGITKGLLVDKLAMNTTMSINKTGVSINEPAIFSEAIIAKGLTLDPESQPETILLTLSSLAVNEVYRRPYQTVYGTAINTASVTTALVVNVWTVPALVYALSLANNCTPIGDTITIDGGVTSHLSSISYNFSYASFDNQAVSYQSAIRINGFIVTSSICDFIIDDMTEIHNVANTSIFPLDANDDISLIVRNVVDNKSISISRMCITINKIFQ